MTTKKLFIELINKKIIFLVIEFYKDNNFKVLDEINTTSKGLENGNIVDLEECVSTIQDCLFKIEKRLDYTFDSVNLIINNQDAEIINLNNTKKLHGDQLTKEDISYIINPLTNLKLNFGLILRELNNDDGFLNTKYYNISLMSDLFNHYYDI